MTQAEQQLREALDYVYRLLGAGNWPITNLMSSTLEAVLAELAEQRREVSRLRAALSLTPGKPTAGDIEWATEALNRPEVSK